MENHCSDCQFTVHGIDTSWYSWKCSANPRHNLINGEPIYELCEIKRDPLGTSRHDPSQLIKTCPDFKQKEFTTWNKLKTLIKKFVSGLISLH